MFLLILFSSCTEDNIEFYNEPLQKNQTIKNSLDQKQKLIELAEGIKNGIEEYNNQYRKPNKFKRKYGRFDTSNYRVISFPQFSDEKVIVIPFKKNKQLKKNKQQLFIAYYKNGDKTYKVLRKKKYKKNLRAPIEEGFLKHLNVLFDYVYHDSKLVSNKTVLLKAENCTWQTVEIDHTNCTALEFNECTGQYRVVDLAEDSWDCSADELDEVELEAPLDPDACPDGYEEDAHGVCVPVSDNTGGNNDDPYTDPDDPNSNCDEMAFDCDTGGDNEENSDCPVGQSKNKDGECVGDCDTTKDDLKEVFPDTSDSKLQEIADAINKYEQDFGIDSKIKLQHFLAQAGHESGRFKVFEENLNYRISKLGEVYWKKYFNPISDPNKDPDKADPNDYRRSTTSDFVDKEKFANLVYGNRMGNGSDEGYKYRGRGIIQLTGKNNYNAFNTFYKENYDNSVDLIANPDLLSTDTKIAVISALWFFKKVMDKVPIDEDTTVKKITKIVNGGTNGLSDRENIKNSTELNIDCV